MKFSAFSRGKPHPHHPWIKSIFFKKSLTIRVSFHIIEDCAPRDVPSVLEMFGNETRGHQLSFLGRDITQLPIVAKLQVFEVGRVDPKNDQKMKRELPRGCGLYVCMGILDGVRPPMTSPGPPWTAKPEIMCFFLANFKLGFLHVWEELAAEI